MNPTLVILKSAVDKMRANPGSQAVRTEVLNTLAGVRDANPKYAASINAIFARIDPNRVPTTVSKQSTAKSASGGGGDEMTDEERIESFLAKIVPANQLKKGFDSIIGYTDVKMRMCTGIMAPLEYPELNASLETKASGALLYGPGGTGKTQFVKALAYETKAPLFFITGSMIQSKFVGEGPKNMKALLTAVEQTANDPKNKGVILFIDEADAIFEQKDKSSGDIVNEFKSNFNPALNVATIVATNDPTFFEDGAVARRLGGLAIYVGIPATESGANFKSEVTCGSGFKTFKNYENDAMAITNFYIADFGKCDGIKGSVLDNDEWNSLVTTYPTMLRLTPDNLRTLVTRAQQTMESGKQSFFGLKYVPKGGDKSWEPLPQGTTAPNAKSWTEMTSQEQSAVCWPGVEFSDLARVLASGAITPTTTLDSLQKFLTFAKKLPDEKTAERIAKDIKKFQ